MPYCKAFRTAFFHNFIGEKNTLLKDNAQSVATCPSSADRAASSADVSSQNHGGNSWEGSWNQPAMAHRLDGG